jgi:hypothetical protein
LELENEEKKKSKVRKGGEREQESRPPESEPVVEPGNEIENEVLELSLKGKIELNPRESPDSENTLEINPSRGSGSHRQVKVALMLIADAKLRERRVRVALTMFLKANLVKCRATAALMTRKVMIR